MTTPAGRLMPPRLAWLARLHAARWPRPQARQRPGVPYCWPNLPNACQRRPHPNKAPWCRAARREPWTAAVSQTPPRGLHPGASSSLWAARVASRGLATRSCLVAGVRPAPPRAAGRRVRQAGRASSSVQPGAARRSCGQRCPPIPARSGQRWAPAAHSSRRPVPQPLRSAANAERPTGNGGECSA